MSKIKHMFSYSTSTVRQILPVIIAGYRQILPVQALECTYLLGLQAGMETAIYSVTQPPKGNRPMKNITSALIRNQSMKDFVNWLYSQLVIAAFTFVLLVVPQLIERLI